MVGEHRCEGSIEDRLSLGKSNEPRSSDQINPQTRLSGILRHYGRR